ncbi:MAG: hypothetical protein BWY59_00457 [Verrucomicrobia bacterium ADurb.Bin345]|nr:MAG: hypothetical protein BWY59_00457 [Verrucomicrobia bacterium ADurb.Bin345]
MELYTSAVTLSDMEIFVFPELLYSLVLANIMSPRIWAWRDDPWFAKLDKMTPYRRVLRLKQFIIDHYEFNLDLETWGLTTQQEELARFAPFMDKETISRSNALFGYEGDKYYFDIEIRKHFGLDKFDSNAIPYWKTETVEAMDAFRFKPGYRTGAGECVSLSGLYAAALFVVCRVPLEQIYLMATPLHSQNFVDVADGILTNNRRVVTRKMWFNGTELTAKSQRALRNEQVTIVSHHTGHIHVVYPEATIRADTYRHFCGQLQAYLTTEINMEILANYLRQNAPLQKCFQIMHEVGGKRRFIPAETVYHYEHGSSYLVSDQTREKLLEEIDEDEYYAQAIDGRIPLNRFEAFFRENRLDLAREEDRQRLAREFTCYNARAAEIVEDICRFTHLEPRLPDAGSKQFAESAPIRLTPEMTREQVVALLESLRPTHRVADLSFYAARELGRTDWTPFLKAAMERNPVCLAGAKDMADQQVLEHLSAMPNESVYDGSRAAQPDEVWNYGRGDGLERALCLANILKKRHPDRAIKLVSDGDARLECGEIRISWPTAKGLRKELAL